MKTQEERKEDIDRARRFYADGEASPGRAVGMHAAAGVLLTEVDALTAERDAWKAYAQAQRAIRTAEHHGDGHADFEAKRDLASATGALRELGIDPSESDSTAA